MDPGNWATDLAGGSAFGYTLLSVILLSNLMAILLQSLCAKLGIVTGRDLAQACRDHYSRPVSFGLWILCELAICACDLAEVIGSAIALNLLFGIPLIWGVCITALDVLAVMYLQNKGFRYIEALVVTLIVTIGGCFFAEILFSKPDVVAVFGGFLPRFEIIQNPEMLYIAIGILGATVMPHNLYLHSSIVQTRKYERTAAGKAEAIKFATIDSTVALMFALFINGAILIVSAATFYGRGETVAEIQDAYKLLVAHARRADREHALRAGAAGVRPELDADGDARGTDRHGRLPADSPASLAAAAHHPAHCDRSGSHCYRDLRRARHGQPVGAQSGHPEPSAAICRRAAGRLHEQSRAKWANSSIRRGSRAWRGSRRASSSV